MFHFNKVDWDVESVELSGIKGQFLVCSIYDMTTASKIMQNRIPYCFELKTHTVLFIEDKQPFK